MDGPLLYRPEVDEVLKELQPRRSRAKREATILTQCRPNRTQFRNTTRKFPNEIGPCTGEQP